MAIESKMQLLSTLRDSDRITLELCKLMMTCLLEKFDLVKDSSISMLMANKEQQVRTKFSHALQQKLKMALIMRAIIVGTHNSGVQLRNIGIVRKKSAFVSESISLKIPKKNGTRKLANINNFLKMRINFEIK